MSGTDVIAAGFEPDEVGRARSYHRPLYVALALESALSAGLLCLLAFSGVGSWLYAPFRDSPWWAASLGYAAVVVGVATVVRLPISFWRGYLRERRWGFSTQRLPGWLVDRAKGLLVGVVLVGALELGLVGLARALPGWWVVPGAAAFALAVVLLSYVAPVVLEPLFNRFRPLEDGELARSLGELAERAHVRVRHLLVTDASRRTRKVNAYVSGLGRTTRVVLFDTLLERAAPAEVELVVAHELGHRLERHVVKGTVLGAVGAVAATVAVWLALGTDAADPRKLPLVLLVGFALELLALAPGSWLSRRWERAADRRSLELTQAAETFERAHRELARANLSDLDPPRTVYVLLFSHPTPPERIVAARAWPGSRAVLSGR